MRQDMVERLRLAEGLVLQAETILAARPAGEASSDHEAAATHGIDRFAAGLAARLHWQARLSIRTILEDAEEGSGEPRKGGCERIAGLNVVEGAWTWPVVWTKELDGMRRRVERRLSDLDRELERSDGRMGRLHLIGNAYIKAGTFLGVFMLVMQTAMSIGGLFGSRGHG